MPDQTSASRSSMKQLDYRQQQPTPRRSATGGDIEPIRDKTKFKRDGIAPELTVTAAVCCI